VGITIVETALVGLLGVLLGSLVTEILRRKSRIENYSSRVFDKRLQTYEELYKKLIASSSIISDVFENPNYSKEQRKAIVSRSVFELAHFTDKYSFYLNEHVALQSMTLLIGVEDIIDIEDEEEKQKEVQRVWKHLRDTKKMIRKESGIEEMDRLFRTITQAKHKSELIDYYEELKKQERAGERNIKA